MRPVRHHAARCGAHPDVRGRVEGTQGRPRRPAGARAAVYARGRGGRAASAAPVRLRQAHSGRGEHYHPLHGCRPSARQRVHRGMAHRGRRGKEDRLFRRHRQHRPAHHPRPADRLGRGLRAHRVDLRRPQSRPARGLSGRTRGLHPAHARPRRQRGHPVVRRRPHAGAAVFHPPDQGRRHGARPPALPRVCGQPARQRGHARFPADGHKLSRRRGMRAHPQRRQPAVF